MISEPKTTDGSNDGRAGTRPAFIVIYLLIVAALGFGALNAAAYFIGKEKSGVNRYILNGRLPDGRGYLLYCYQGGANRRYDFSLNHLGKSTFSELFVVGSEKMAQGNETYCVMYPGESVNVRDFAAGVPAKLPGDKRLIFIGDSFTYGLGAPYGAAYPYRIGEMLRRCGNPGGWNVLDFGQLGADFPVLYDENFKRALDARPDEIVYTWFVNDIPRHGAPEAEFQRIGDLVNPMKPHSPVRGLPLAKLIKTAVLGRRTTQLTTQMYKDLYGPANAPGLEEMRAYMRRMRDESRAAGAEFKVALFPVMAGEARAYPFRDAHAAMAEILYKENIPFIDLTDAVLARPASSLWVHPLDHHPDAEAHMAAAAELAKFLGLVSPACAGQPYFIGAGHENRPWKWHRSSRDMQKICLAILLGFILTAIAAGLASKIKRQYGMSGKVRLLFICIIALILIVSGANIYILVKPKAPIDALRAIAAAKAPAFPRGTVFYTSSDALYETLKNAALADVTRFAPQAGSEWNCPAGSNCVFAFMTPGGQGNFMGAAAACPDHFTERDMSLYFCDFGEMRRFSLRATGAR